MSLVHVGVHPIVISHNVQYLMVIDGLAQHSYSSRILPILHNIVGPICQVFASFRRLAFVIFSQNPPIYTP